MLSDASLLEKLYLNLQWILLGEYINEKSAKIEV